MKGEEHAVYDSKITLKLSEEKKEVIKTKIGES